MRSTNSTTVSTPNPAMAGLLTEISRQADWSRRLGKMNRRSYRGAARRLKPLAIDRPGMHFSKIGGLELSLWILGQHGFRCRDRLLFRVDGRVAGRSWRPGSSPLASRRCRWGGSR